MRHWNYFISIEQDVETLSRFIEFDISNMDTYSFEAAKILMTSTQELDVLLKQLCKHHGNKSRSEQGYREFLTKEYANITTLVARIPRSKYSFIPFSDWQLDKTPSWWSANNKVKHNRDIHFNKASVDNVLHSVSALLIANIYFYIVVKGKNRLLPVPKIINIPQMTGPSTPTPFGTSLNFKLP